MEGQAYLQEGEEIAECLAAHGHRLPSECWRPPQAHHSSLATSHCMGKDSADIMWNHLRSILEQSVETLSA